MSPPSGLNQATDGRFQKSLDVSARNNSGFKESMGDNPLNVIFGETPDENRQFDANDEKANSSIINQ